MKKTLCAIILLAFAAFLLAGCAPGKVDVSTPKGEKVTIDQDKKEVSVTTKDGTTVVKTEEKDGKVDISVKGPDGDVKIKGDSDSGKGTVEVDGPDGKVKVIADGDNKRVKMESKDGSFEATAGKSARPEDFPVKFYPGAEVSDGSVMDGQSPDGRKFSSRTAILETKDPIEKVKEFYSGQFKKPFVTDAGNNVTIMEDPSAKAGGGTTTIVNIEKDGEGHAVKVTIVTTRGMD
jgi:acylphosphatase